MNFKTYAFTLWAICSSLFNTAQETTKDTTEFQNLVTQLQQYARTGQFQEAIHYGEEAREIAKAQQLENSLLRDVLYKLSILYRRTNNIEKEQEIYAEMNIIRKAELQEENESFSTVFEQLKSFTTKLGSVTNSLQVLDKMNNNLMSHIDNSFKYRFSEEKKVFINHNVIPFLDLYQSLAYRTNYKYNSITNIATNNTITLKGLLMNSSRDILMGLSQMDDPNIKSKVNNYRKERNYLTLQSALPINERASDLETRNQRLDGLEAELATLYINNVSDNTSLIKKWDEVVFKSDAIAIEFSHFNYYNPNKTDSILYVAYLYKRSWKTAKAIPLFEEKQLSEILKSANTPNNLYVSRGSQGSSTTNVNNANKLYELIWKPLESQLEGVNKVYYSPDGLLHKVAFSTLSYNNGATLNEQFDLVQLGTTASIEVKQSEPNKNSVLLFGGIDYDNYPLSMQRTGKMVSSEISTLENGSRGKSSHWNYLEGTLQEVNNIGKILTSAEIITGTNASEEYFKSLSGNSPSVLHIATHGFFFDDKEVNTESLVYEVSEDPLLRSGLLLSGANITWQYGKKAEGTEDGILTALEISNLDLSKTDIVILSACETGLGEIQGSEGVFGLQRAFKLAGVDIIVMSLWQVPDAETAEFMEIFYREWHSGTPIRSAFRKTQKAMQYKYKDEPIKWAAFVLIE